MIDKVTIAIDDMGAMVSFYQAILDVEFEELEMAGHALSRASYGPLEVLLCPKFLAGVEAETNTVQLRFLVPDARLACAAGKAQGGVVLTEPVLAEGATLAALRDPDGNSLELKQV